MRRAGIVYDEKKTRTSAESKGEKPTYSTIKSITASGNVKITKDERMAAAEKPLWDYATRTGALTEWAPRIWEGRDSANAPSIIMYLDENRVELVGG